MIWKTFVPDEEAMIALGVRLAQKFIAPGVIYLHGDLGAGKSTLARGFIKGQGYAGHVKSPTYTLVEPYPLAGKTIYHMDLYRLADPEELEFIGIRDLLGDDTICLIEWPEKGEGVLPGADLQVRIEHNKVGREVSIEALTADTRNIINEL